MDKIIQIIAICFLKSTTKGDSLNSYSSKQSFFRQRISRIKQIFRAMLTEIYFTKPQAATNFTNANRMADFRERMSHSCHSLHQRCFV